MNSHAEPLTSTPRPRLLLRKTGIHAVRLLIGAGIVSIITLENLGGHLPAVLFLIIGLFALACIRALWERHQSTAWVSGLDLGILLGGAFLFSPGIALRLVLVLIQANIAVHFLRSLRPGHHAVITQIASAIGPDQSSRVFDYTRAVTWAWGLFMAMLAGISLGLTFASTPALWRLWQNRFSLALPIAFFVAEWLFRQWYLRGEDRPGVLASLKALSHIDYRRIFQA